MKSILLSLLFSTADSQNLTQFDNGGFRDDGPLAIWNECARAPTICGDNAKCWDKWGNYICTCNAGYSGIPPVFPCINVNECVIIPCICGAFASCWDTPGSYRCLCNIGYQGFPPTIPCTRKILVPFTTAASVPPIACLSMTIAMIATNTRFASISTTSETIAKATNTPYASISTTSATIAKATNTPYPSISTTSETIATATNTPYPSISTTSETIAKATNTPYASISTTSATIATATNTPYPSVSTTSASIPPYSNSETSATIKVRAASPRTRRPRTSATKSATMPTHSTTVVTIPITEHRATAATMPSPFKTTNANIPWKEPTSASKKTNPLNCRCCLIVPRDSNNCSSYFF